jgi:hypothetical protein
MSIYFDSTLQYNSPTGKQLTSSLQSFENAFTFSSLYSLNPEYLQTPSKLINEFDLFIERGEANDSDIVWAYNLSLKYNPNFLIEIPKFIPSDLLPLFVKQLESKYSPGFLFPGLVSIHDLFLKQLFELNQINFNSLADLLNKISEVSLIFFLQRDIKNNFQSEISKAVKEKLPSPENEIFQTIEKLYSICISQDSINEIHFKIEDLFFLKTNWMDNLMYCSKYPSLTFWLIVNEEEQHHLH